MRIQDVPSGASALVSVAGSRPDASGRRIGVVGQVNVKTVCGEQRRRTRGVWRVALRTGEEVELGRHHVCRVPSVEVTALGRGGPGVVAHGAAEPAAVPHLLRVARRGIGFAGIQGAVVVGVFITVLDAVGLDQGRVRARHLRLGHREAGAGAAVAEGYEVLLLLLKCQAYNTLLKQMLQQAL